MANEWLDVQRGTWKGEILFDHSRRRHSGGSMTTYGLLEKPIQADEIEGLRQENAKLREELNRLKAMLRPQQLEALAREAAARDAVAASEEP